MPLVLSQWDPREIITFQGNGYSNIATRFMKCFSVATLTFMKEQQIFFLLPMSLFNAAQQVVSTVP